MSDLQDRATARDSFLRQAGWAAAAADSLAGDASSRSYERLTLGDTRALLMNAPLGAETAPCAPDADETTRRALGYNALARLAGPNLNAFTAIADTLRAGGLSAPEIFAADAEHGFALIEDFGDDLYARAVTAGADERMLYTTAIDALVALRKADLRPPKAPGYEMLSYDRLALEAEISLLTEWYWRHKTGADPEPALAEEFRAAFAPALDALSAPDTIVLRDYHAENILWLPERNGAARAGLIDFQDGLYGWAAYDLVGLLEDARRDVDASLAEAMLAHYCTQAAMLGGFDEQALRRDYAILGAQRNAKILGIFARLVHRDGKARYLDFMPRVEALFKNNLRHEALAPLARFFNAHMPDLAP